MPMAREPLSVVVITLNNADTLDHCLASVAWADDIVVLDSGSTDATRRIAESHGARFSTQDRKSTRLNSSHVSISYAVFCLKKKRSNSRDEGRYGNTNSSNTRLSLV